MTLGSWHHVVGVIDAVNNYRAIYVDGVLKASDSSAIPPMTVNDESLFIGGRNSSLPFWHDGLLDGVAIYDRALSAAEVLARYNGGELIGNEAGLISCWNFNEGTGITAYDCTANGNDGIINGAMWSSN